MDERFDAVVLGIGPGGEVTASKLLKSGKRVAVVERELIGGECAYWACVPSKTLLRPPEAKGEVDRGAGVHGAQLDWPSTRQYRNYMIRHLDDSGQVQGYQNSGATVLKGTARITGPGTVEVDGRTLTAEHIIVATGSDAFVPPIEGLDTVSVWTNQEATTLTEIPQRVVMLGGSAVGVELGLFLRRYGAQVTILERSGRLLSREDTRVGELTEGYLRAEGINVRTGTSPTRVRRDGEDTIVELYEHLHLRRGHRRGQVGHPPGDGQRHPHPCYRTVAADAHGLPGPGLTGGEVRRAAAQPVRWPRHPPRRRGRAAGLMTSRHRRTWLHQLPGAST